MGDVRFVGQSPYVLPTPQHTKVYRVQDGVEVHIRLLETQPNLHFLDAVFRLTNKQAELLVVQLKSGMS
ncbi:MAG TPA: hypothetical protein VII56_17525 [Rhizomicrobium sp.]